MSSFVVFDLETTGLDSKSDAIIEIALVRLDENFKIIDEFSSLVNPGMPIPEDAQAITGITNEDIISAPYFSDIRETVRSFIGDAVLVAHNADFDTAFLKEYGIDVSSLTILDTFRLASVAFLEERSLNLSSLSESLGYMHEGAHRALSDTHATAFLLSKIVERFKNANENEKKILSFLVFFASESRQLSYTLSLLHLKEMVSLDDVKRILLDTHPEWSHTDVKIEVPEEITADDIFTTSLLEERGEQRKMLHLVEEAFSSKKEILIEAPTGIGKTFAYGIPSILHAIKTEKKVIISTHTRTLQDQIAFKDIAKLREIFAEKGISGFEVAKLKWRTNYLSFLRFFEFLESDFEHTDEYFFFVAKVFFWLLKSKDGELDDLSFYGKEYVYRDEIHAGDLRILSQDNPFKKHEFLHKAREYAKSAHIILVNHALLLSEIGEDASGNLGKLSNIVIDEAHNLEDSATDALMRTLSFPSVEREFAHIEGAIRRNNKRVENEPFVFPEWVSYKESLTLSFGMLFDFILQYGQFKAGVAQDRKEYGRGRMNEILLGSDIVLRDGYNGVLNILSSLRDKVHELHERLFTAPEKLVDTFADPIGALESACGFFEDFLSEVREDLIRVISMRRDDELTLKIAPLDVSPILREKLWKNADCVVLTSATLSAGDDFEFVNKALGLSDFVKHSLASDFDYSKQALVFIPTDFTDVRKEGDRLRSIDFTREMIERMGGRSMCLFTSFASIREAHLRMLPGLKAKGIDLLAQGMSGGKQKMIEQFKKNSHKSAILGTESFWEGVDIPGSDLELVVIQKLPFAVPTDPIVQARSRLYTDPFREYSFPEMLLKLRQWMGRLIRTKEDRGIIVLLDGRANGSWSDAIFRAFPSNIRVKRGESGEFLKTYDAFLARRQETSIKK